MAGRSCRAGVSSNTRRRQRCAGFRRLCGELDLASHSEGEVAATNASSDECNNAEARRHRDGALGVVRQIVVVDRSDCSGGEPGERSDECCCASWFEDENQTRVTEEDRQLSVALEPTAAWRIRVEERKRLARSCRVGPVGRSRIPSPVPAATRGSFEHRADLASVPMGWFVLSVAELVLGIVVCRTSFMSRYMRWSSNLLGRRDQGDLAWMNKVLGGTLIVIGALGLTPHCETWCPDAHRADAWVGGRSTRTGTGELIVWSGAGHDTAWGGIDRRDGAGGL